MCEEISIYRFQGCLYIGREILEYNANPPRKNEYCTTVEWIGGRTLLTAPTESDQYLRLEEGSPSFYFSPTLTYRARL